MKRLMCLLFGHFPRTPDPKWRLVWRPGEEYTCIHCGKELKRPNVRD